MDMSKYRSIFLTEVREHLDNMNQLVIALEKEAGDKGNIDSLFRAAHSVKGMAASMGYEDIAKLSHKMEDMMDRFRKKDMAMTPEATDILLEGIDSLERLIEAVEQDRPAEAGIAELIERIEGYLSVNRQEEAGAGHPSMITPHPAGTNHRSPATVLSISIDISQESPAPAVRAFLIYRKLKEYGEIISVTPSEADIRNGRFSGRLSLRLDTCTGKDRIEEVIRDMGEVAGLSVGPHAPDAVSHKEKEQELPKVVKVGTSLLDSFVDAIGEIIINKSRLHEISRGMPSGELRDGLNQLDRLVGDLQDKVMSVRMMPVGSIMERLPRVVRDLARKQEKEVDFKIEGQDVELDRSILEGLGNPLIHIIRNSMDHGIESPDERRAMGKPLPATIYIKASRERDQVFIEAYDDGRGMEPEMLKEAAVKKGLITDEQALTMGNKEALFLICLPGFSTAREVSDISGRGVGMDAVMSAVKPLGGSIDIDSKPGAWSRITIRLPLTAAIINSLIVEAASEVYALPINRVLRTLEIHKEDIKGNQEQEFADIEGASMQLHSLSRMFGLPSLTQFQKRFIPVIVTDIKGSPAGLVVDRLLGQQETFIKPLSRPLSRIAGLAGTTVLGSGRTIFLLDMENLIRPRKTPDSGPVMQQQPG